MTIPPIPRRDFYVYALFREDGITPFYIGKGRGTRVHIHEKDARRWDTSHKARVIQKMWACGITEIPKVVLAEGLLDVDAKLIECDLIQLIGRWPLGPLTNLTSGGDGVADLSPVSRARKSAANIASWADPAVREKRSAGMKAVWTPEKRAQHSAQKKAAQTPEFIAKLVAAQAKRVRPPKPAPDMEKLLAERAMRCDAGIAARKAYWAANPRSAELVRRLVARITSPECMAKSHATNRLPDIRAKRIAAQKAAFSTPEAKARRSAAQKERWRKWGRRKHQYVDPLANCTLS